jgi:hypothetical protein
MRASHIRSAVIAVLLLAGTGVHADLVKLTGGRALHVVAVTTQGAEATLSLQDGGSVTVPVAQIESVTLEPVTSTLCGASPYLCQDRAMLLTRRAHAQVLAEVVARQHTATP